jgi:hypothetical protein
VPTVVICSDEFGPLGRAEAEVLGLGGLPLIAVPHPVAGNHRQLVAAKARAVADEVVDALTTDRSALAERYRARFTRLTQKRLPHGAVCVDEECAVDLALRPVGSR